MQWETWLSGSLDKGLIMLFSKQRFFREVRDVKGGRGSRGEGLAGGSVSILTPFSLDKNILR